MLMQTTLRAAARRSVAPRNARGLHVENTVYNNMPFSYRNKKTFAVKVAAYLGVGFAIPFIAAGYQLNKSGGAGATA